MNRHNSSSRKFDLISMEDGENMQMAKKTMTTEVKGLVGGGNHNLQCQVLQNVKQNLR